MQRSSSPALAFRALVVLASIAGMFLLTVFLNVVLKIDVPRAYTFVIGFAIGSTVVFYLNRDQIAKNSDLNSPETRSRITATLISSSHSKN